MIDLKKHIKSIQNRIEDLPEKLNFKIGEVGNILGIPNHALRYWEKEFPILKPEKFINNQRLYTKKDIKILLLIKALLYEEKFSIEGLRKHLPSYYKQFQQMKEEMPRTPESKNHAEQKVHQLLNSISELRSTIDHH